jgi:hypothetical protein
MISIQMGKNKWNELKKKIAEDWDSLTEEQYKAVILCDLFIQEDSYMPYESSEILIDMIDNVVSGVVQRIKHYYITDEIYRISVEEIYDYLAIIHLLTKYRRDENSNA